MKIVFLIFLLIVKFCDATEDELEVECTEVTREHTSECNKYFKCIKLPSNRISWITLTCQEGLIYDKNLRSCAIAPEDWECSLSSGEVRDDTVIDDDSNVYGVDNLEILKNEDGEDFVVEIDDDRQISNDDFLEVIDGDKNLKSETRSDEENSIFSGDGGVVENIVTPSSVTKQITTQVQRLTQLMSNFAGYGKQDVTADDLNSFLDTQKIQSNNFQEFIPEGKTPLPKNGKVHPEILTEIVSRQNSLKKLSTPSMDQMALTSTVGPIHFINSGEPITEIKLKGGPNGQNGAHQIVVNRPEGSVLFMPPPSSSSDNKHAPYLSNDILKTILEISKQMITQNHNQQQKVSDPHVNYQPQPIYYAVPIPVLSPQSGVQNYYGQFPNHSAIVTTSTTTTTKVPKRRKKPIVKLDISQPVRNKNELNNYSPQSYGELYYPAQSQSSALKNQQYFYNNYPSYSSAYNNPFYNPSQSSNYYQQQYPMSNSDGSNYNQFNNYDSFYYGKRPFVIDSSAPSTYLDHQTYSQEPFRKESYVFDHSSDEADDEEEHDENKEEYDMHEESEEEETMKVPEEELICTPVLARQANKTDCYKYYVCNSKTKEVLSYTCPMLTAFNDQTKFCDSASYTACKNIKDNTPNYNVVQSQSNKSSNKRKAALQAAQKIQNEQKLTNYLKQKTQNFIAAQSELTHQLRPQNPYQQQNVRIPPPSMQFNSPAQVIKRDPPKKIKPPPSNNNIQVLKQKKKKTKKKSAKVKCKNPGSIADPNDKFSYWHCFKDVNDGRMKRIHKKCSPNLVFCATSRFCSASC